MTYASRMIFLIKYPFHKPFNLPNLEASSVHIPLVDLEGSEGKGSFLQNNWKSLIRYAVPVFSLVFNADTDCQILLLEVK